MHLPHVALTCALALTPLAGCGDDGGGGSGACELVGEPHALPYPWLAGFDVAALGDTFVVVVATEDGDVVGYTIGADGALSGPTELELGRGQVHMTSRAGEVLAQSFPTSWQLDGPRLARFDGASWSYETGAAFTDPGLATRGAALVATPDRVTVGWVDGVSTADAFTADWSGGALGAASPALADVDELSGYSLHLDYDTAGALHMAAIGTAGGQRGLVHATRDASGTWGATSFVGTTPGALQNIVVTGLAADPTGGVWLAEVHESDFFDETTGGLTVWRDDGAGATKVGTVADDRVVVEGLSLGALEDGRLVASASWGENNFDAARAGTRSRSTSAGRPAGVGARRPSTAAAGSSTRRRGSPPPGRRGSPSGPGRRRAKARSRR